MTAGEIIADIDSLKPNAFTAAQKLRWLNELEGRVGTEVLLLGAAEVESLTLTADYVPLVAAPYDDIYRYWLIARIDEGNGEWNNYDSSRRIFNEAWGRFVRWFAARYEPAQGYPSEDWRARNGFI